MEQETRGLHIAGAGLRIAEYLAANGSGRIPEIVRDLGIPRGTVGYWASLLGRAGLIHTERVPGAPQRTPGRYVWLK